MESWPQNPEFRNNPENFHPCLTLFLASRYFCRLLISFANSLDPDQDRMSVQICIKKKSAENKSMKIYQACNELFFYLPKYLYTDQGVQDNFAE